MELQSERLRLIPLSEELAPEMAELYREDWPYLKAWSPDRGPRFFTAEGQEERLATRAAENRDGKAAAYAVFEVERDLLLGTAEITDIIRGPFQSGYLGYWIARRGAGQGYATEAVRRVADYAFKELSLHRLEAGIMPRNVRSIRVAEKAGFRCEGVSHSYLKIAGRWEDMLRYVRLSPT